MTLTKNSANVNAPAEALLGSMVDIGPFLASLDGNTRQAAENVLARALIYAEDADEALKRAVSIRSEAQRYRAEVETAAVQATERLCAELRAEAQQELDEAREAREEAEAKKAEAERERRQAEALRVEADESKKRTEAEARDQAAAVLAEAREQAAKEAAEMRRQVAEEIRKAVAGIQKMRDATQAELDAQKIYTEALRIKAMAPTRDDMTDIAASAGAVRSKVRSTRQKPAA
jgi:hypothetical protein